MNLEVETTSCALRFFVVFSAAVVVNGPPAAALGFGIGDAWLDTFHTGLDNVMRMHIHLTSIWLWCEIFAPSSWHSICRPVKVRDWFSQTEFGLGTLIMESNWRTIVGNHWSSKSSTTMMIIITIKCKRLGCWSLTKLLARSRGGEHFNGKMVKAPISTFTQKVALFYGTVSHKKERHTESGRAGILQLYFLRYCIVVSNKNHLCYDCCCALNFSRL